MSTVRIRSSIIPVGVLIRKASGVSGVSKCTDGSVVRLRGMAGAPNGIPVREVRRGQRDGVEVDGPARLGALGAPIRKSWVGSSVVHVVTIP